MIAPPPACWDQQLTGLYGESLGRSGNLIHLDSTVVYIDWDQEAVDAPDDGNGNLAVSPNPCNGHVTIRFDLPRQTRATINVLDLQGRLVRVLLSDQRDAGPGATTWDCRHASGEPAASGVYYVHLATDGGNSIRKVTLVK